MVTTRDSRSAFVADSFGAIFEYALGTGSPRFEKKISFQTNGASPNQPPSPAEISPLGLALTPDGHYLVAAAGSGAVVFDVANIERRHSRSSSWVIGHFRSKGQEAIEVAVSPDGKYVFVTLEDSDDLAVFDLRAALRKGFHRSDLVGTVPLGVAPVGMALSPDGRYLYVTSEGRSEGTLTTLDISMAERSPSRSIVSTVDAGCSPVRVVATSTYVYVTARGSDSVLEFQAADLVDDPAAALLNEVQVGETPVGLALVEQDRALVVSDSDRFAAPGQGADLAFVSIGSGGSLQLEGYLSSGSFPRDMAASRNGRWLVVSNYLSSQVEIVDLSTLPHT
ncbi:MAG: beta-propeller fold lactonase family protein [Acidimicrobiales bacterium]